jgi:hypothetical protein
MYYSRIRSVWDFKFSWRRVWCSELSSGIYCRVKWLSTDVSDINPDPFVLGSLIPDDGGSTHLWNVGRQSFYTAVYPRRQLWTSESEVSVRHSNICQTACKAKSCLSYRLHKLYKIADSQVVAVFHFCSSCLRISFYCLLRRHWLNFRVLIYITWNLQCPWNKVKKLLSVLLLDWWKLGSQLQGTFLKQTDAKELCVCTYQHDQHGTCQQDSGYNQESPRMLH